MWIQGPKFLLDFSLRNSEDEHYPLIDSDTDKEIRPEVQVVKTRTVVQDNLHELGTHRFTRFSEWRTLVRIISLLKHFIRRWKNRNDKSERADEYKSPEALKQAEQFIIREVQLENYRDEIECISNGTSISKNSSLSQLSPMLDNQDILRVSGRLRNYKDCEKLAELSKHPIIMPRQNHVSVLLVRYFHGKVSHQGRSFTDGAIRDAGFWIVGGRRLVSSVIHQCITCRKLRGRFAWQQMADLPEDRLKPSPPFTFVGVDTFGPWPVAYRRTRGTHTNQKRWALLFTCLVSRAIHIEVIEELSSASFINAMRRFIALRGPVKQFRSDRGTNFIGGSDELNTVPQFVEKRTL